MKFPLLDQLLNSPKSKPQAQQPQQPLPKSKTWQRLELVGLGFLGYSISQYLGFLAAGYPKLSFGAIIVMVGIAVAILTVGYENWLGIQLRGLHRGFLGVLIGFAPSFVFGAVFLLAITAGVYVAVGK